jgi:hypothetical protein|eukprot:Tamp_32536.p2 GENE.Tamp_32536~~Tamp_32536.p2  ORF type:complete len:111 (+),score=22.07 Tamp_32536:150-482(+)
MLPRETSTAPCRQAALWDRITCTEGGGVKREHGEARAAAQEQPLWERMTCTETPAAKQKRPRGGEQDVDDDALADFRGIANVVVELEKLVERRGKRLCSFQQFGPCAQAV